MPYWFFSWLADWGDTRPPISESKTCSKEKTIGPSSILLAKAGMSALSRCPTAGGHLSETLKDSSAGAGQGRSHRHILSLLVVSEVALACVLLVGAGLLLRSFVNVLNVISVLNLIAQPRSRSTTTTAEIFPMRRQKMSSRAARRLSSRFSPKSARYLKSRQPVWSITFPWSKTANGARPAQRVQAIAKAILRTAWSTWSLLATSTPWV